MDASTTINQMLSGNKIFVPTYQRAYSWEDKQTKQFLVDLQDYVEREPYGIKLLFRTFSVRG